MASSGPSVDISLSTNWAGIPEPRSEWALRAELPISDPDHPNLHNKRALRDCCGALSRCRDAPAMLAFQT